MAGKGKGSGTGQVGRPPTFGTAQLAHFDGRQRYYNAKRDDKATTQGDMTTFLDDEVFLFFAKFGWNDPLSSVPQALPEPTPEAIAERRVEAAIAKIQVKGEGGSEVHKKRDELIQHVRSLMSARFTSKYKKQTKETTTNSRSSADITKLLLAYIEKPSLKHLYQVWAKSCPDLDAEVNRRLPEVRLQKGDPEYKRIGLWNKVAAERYAATSEQEKEETLLKAKQILSDDMKSWEDGLSEPQSMDEAIAFMLASQSFLEDLMQFFADRCGGMAVMILAGSGKVMVSEGTCNIPGKPKILYSGIEQEQPVLQAFAERIHTQACLVTESRWGVRLSDVTDTTSPSAQCTDEDVCVELVDRLSLTSPPRLPGDGAPPFTPPEDKILGDRAGDVDATADLMSGGHATPMLCAQDNDASMPANDQEQNHAPVELNGSGCSGIDIESSDGPSPCATKPKPRPKPRMRTPPSAVTAPVSTLMKASDANIRTERPDEKDGGIPANLTGTLVSECEEGTDEEARRRVVNTRAEQGEPVTPMSGRSGVATEQELSVFAFQSTGGNVVCCDEVVYRKECSADGAVIEARKTWFVLHGMTGFLLAIPAKLKGKVDIGLACKVARAYMKLELSNAGDDVLDLGRYKVDSHVRPAYTADLQKKAKVTKTTWSKMAPLGANRTPSLLDIDVGASLARQWVCQQPNARRSEEGTLRRAADGSMDWEGRLPPGAHGVRLLVVTLLCWGSALNENALAEKREWNKLAQDFADVLDVLAVQAGMYKAPEVDPNMAQGEGMKRIKKVTEKAALMLEAQPTKSVGGRT